MPTQEHHLSSVIGGMFQTVSDKISLVAAGVLGFAPLWPASVQDGSSTGFVTWGQILAGLLVVSKIILTWVQIWKEARAQRPN